MAGHLLSAQLIIVLRIHLLLRTLLGIVAMLQLLLLVQRYTGRVDIIVIIELVLGNVVADSGVLYRCFGVNVVVVE